MSEQHYNELGQPIGAPLPGWSPRPLPPRTPIEGRFCRVEPLDPDRHAADLFAANSEDAEGRNWTYLPHGPYPAFDLYRGGPRLPPAATTRWSTRSSTGAAGMPSGWRA